MVTDISVAIIGIVGGTILTLVTKRIIQNLRESHATLRDQLRYVFSPLEILLKVNRLGYDRYFKPKTTQHDKEFIEKQIWFPNNTEIKKIIMEHSHLLDEVPPIIITLIEHIDVWLSEYELIYEKFEKDPPVFVAQKGYAYPKEADEYIYNRSTELRVKLNRKRIRKKSKSNDLEDSESELKR